MSDPFKRYETPWMGWNWIYGMYLVDPNGNRYSQEMIQSSIFAMQYQQNLLGSSLQIHSLKSELQKRIDSYKPPQVVIHWGDGVQTLFERTY